MHKNRRTATTESIRLEDSVSTKISLRELQKSNIHGRSAIVKPMINANNAKRRKRWCDDHKTWTSNGWKYVQWSAQSSFALFPTSGRVCVWRTPKKAYNPEGQFGTVKHGGGYVKVCVAISWYSSGPVITLNGRITVSDYMDILGNQLFI